LSGLIDVEEAAVEEVLDRSSGRQGIAVVVCVELKARQRIRRAGLGRGLPGLEIDRAPHGVTAACAVTP
jgi:hypothetical protein